MRIISRNFNLKDIDINEKLIDSYLNEAQIVLEDKIRFFSKKTNDSIQTKILFDELNDFIDIQKIKLDAVAKILIYKSLGYKTILVNTNDCIEHELINLDANVLNYSQIPPFNYGCKCLIDIESLYEYR